MFDFFSPFLSLGNRLGKKLGFDFSSVVKSGSWIGARFFVLAISGWVVSLCFARLSTKTLLGQYQFVLAVLSMVSILSLPGLNAAALEATVKQKERAILKAIRVSFRFSLLAIPVVAGIASYFLLVRGESGLAISFFLASILVPIMYAFNTWSVYYDGKSLFKDTSLRIIALNVLLSGFLILGLLLNFNLVGLIATYLVINVLVSSFYFLELRRKINPQSEDELDFTFGVNVSIQKFVFGLSSNIPPVAISYFFGVEATALYYIAYYIVSAIFAFLGNMTYLYLPKLFRGDALQHHSVLLQNLLVGVLGWVAYILFLHFFFLLLYGEEYFTSMKIGYAISFVLFLVPFKTYLMTYFMTRRRNWFLIVVAVIANVVGLVILYLFKNQGFFTSVVWYMYTLEILTTLPLLFVYWQKTVREEALALESHKDDLVV